MQAATSVSVQEFGGLFSLTDALFLWTTAENMAPITQNSSVRFSYFYLNIFLFDYFVCVFFFKTWSVHLRLFQKLEIRIGLEASHGMYDNINFVQ